MRPLQLEVFLAKGGDVRERSDLAHNKYTYEPKILVWVLFSTEVARQRTIRVGHDLRRHVSIGRTGFPLGSPALDSGVVFGD